MMRTRRILMRRNSKEKSERHEHGKMDKYILWWLIGLAIPRQLRIWGRLGIRDRTSWSS